MILKTVKFRPSKKSNIKNDLSESIDELLAMWYWEKKTLSYPSIYLVKRLI